MTTHINSTCCLCGVESDLLQRAEGHRFCLHCVSVLSHQVSSRVERGAKPRPGREAAESALLDILAEWTLTCTAWTPPAPEPDRETVAHPLAVPFEDLSFPLPCSGRTYTVAVERIHCQPLHPGTIEWSPDDEVDSEDCDFMFGDVREDEDRAVQQLTKHLSALWGEKKSWTLLTPSPDHRTRAFRDSKRIFGMLCAAVLQSSDHCPPQADYSEACVIYMTWANEGLLPERVKALIDWEALAIPKVV